MGPLVEYRITEAKVVLGARRSRFGFLRYVLNAVQLALLLVWVLGVIRNPTDPSPWIAGVLGGGSLLYFFLSLNIPVTRARPAAHRFTRGETATASIRDGVYTVRRGGRDYRLNLADLLRVERAVGIVFLKLHNGKTIYVPAALFPGRRFLRALSATEPVGAQPS
ncbi:hypothetical protein [Curtobacterium sp. MCBD17_040]|uniref:hypothetical protein n=1 Tax=Curtobacterium sp. MCBD17_040 TaxID=2175674 RepID=UPI0024DFC1F5|nr:hypothetical protein [Curtobacterium sp. MCBD17_040]WIB65888.1 hypothetical protein DEI94_17385 [Curtobacterium sp. MCBD17_040]